MRFLVSEVPLYDTLAQCPGRRLGYGRLAAAERSEIGLPYRGCISSGTPSYQLLVSAYCRVQEGGDHERGSLWGYGAATLGESTGGA